jgi:hypothetical protein
VTSMIQGYVYDVWATTSTKLSGTARGVSGAVVTIGGYSDSSSGTANSSGHYAFDADATLTRSGSVSLEGKTLTFQAKAPRYITLEKSVLVSSNATVNAYLLPVTPHGR